MPDRSKQIHMEHQVNKKSKTNDVRRIPDKKFLNLFTILAEGNEKERIKTTDTLIHRIKVKQAAVNEGLCEEAEYSVERLVKGLASSRVFARLGYSIALCQLLRNVESITTQTVLDAIDKNLAKSKDASKSDVGSVSLGKIFGYLSLIQSGKLFNEGSKDHKKEVVEKLLELSTSKSYLQQLCVNGIGQVIAQLKEKTFRKHIYPLVESQFTAGWGNCTPDSLLLVLHSNRYHKETVSGMLKDHWLGEELITEKNFPLIADVVMKATHCFPVIHCVIDELVQEVLQKNLNLITFWKQVVHPLFEAKGTAVPKRAVGIHIFNLILDKLDKPKMMKSMLQPDVITVLVQYDPKKKGDLADRAAALLKRLVKVSKDSQDPQMQLTILKCLIQSPGSPQFDIITKTNTLSNIIADLLPEAAELFAQELMNTFKHEQSWICAEGSYKHNTMNWCIKEMVTLIVLYKLSPEWQLSVLQLLLINGFFTVKKSSSDIQHCTVQKEGSSRQNQQSLRDNFYRATSKLAVIRKRGESLISTLGNTLDVLYGLVKYFQMLLNNPDHVQLEIETFSTEAQEEWNKVVELLKAMDKKRHGEDKVVASHAFEILFIHEGFQLLKDPEGATELLQDLYVCYKKSGQRRKSKAVNDEDPPWMDVITEVLLNLMFKGSAASRDISKVVMNILSDHVTSTSLQLIVDALKQKGVDSEDGILGLEEDEDMEEGEEDEPDTLDEDVPASESEEGDSDDEDDSEASDEEDKEVTQLDQLKQRVKRALGEAAVNTDNEEESEEEEEEAAMSDSEMEKLDDMLAEAFRSMKKGKNSRKEKQEKENQLKVFKIRVLDLVEVLCKQSPAVVLLKTCLVPLLQLMKLGNVRQEDRALGTRAKNIYQILCKGKKVTPNSDSEREDLLILLGQLLKEGTPECIHEVVNGCAFVIRTLLNIHDSSPSPLKTRAKAAATDTNDKTKKDHDYYQEKVVQTVRARMMDMFSKNSSPYPPLVFQLLIQRFQAIFWGLFPDLLATIGSDEFKLFHKEQAAQYLSAVINRGLVKDVGQESWARFLKGYHMILSEALDDLVKGPKIKRVYVRELLTVILKINAATPELVTQVLAPDVVSKLSVLSQKIDDQPTWNCYLNVMKTLQSGNIPKWNKKKKKRKNQGNLEESSPTKMSKLDTTGQAVNGNSDSQEKHLKDSGISSPKQQKKVENFGASSPKHEKAKDFGTSSPKQKKGEELGIGTPKHKKNKGDLNKKNGDTNVVVNGGSKEKFEADSIDSCAQDEAMVAGLSETPKSEKKKRKKKRKSQGDLNGGLESPVNSPKVNIPEKKAKMPKSPIVDTNSQTMGNGVKSPEANLDSNANVDSIKSPKETKFSPRYTRSKKRQKNKQN